MKNALCLHRQDEPSWVTDDEDDVPEFVNVTLDDIDLGEFYVRCFDAVVAVVDTASGRVDRFEKPDGSALKIWPEMADVIDRWLSTPAGLRLVQLATDEAMDGGL